MNEFGDRFGEIFELKGGPIRQYWIRDAEGSLAFALMSEQRACAGRSQLKEPAFGDEFLFLTRDLQRAKVRRLDELQSILLYFQSILLDE